MPKMKSLSQLLFNQQISFIFSIDYAGSTADVSRQTSEESWVSLFIGQMSFLPQPTVGANFGFEVPGKVQMDRNSRTVEKNH